MPEDTQTAMVMATHQVTPPTVTPDPAYQILQRSPAKIQDDAEDPMIHEAAEAAEAGQTQSESQPVSPILTSSAVRANPTLQITNRVVRDLSAVKGTVAEESLSGGKLSKSEAQYMTYEKICGKAKATDWPVKKAYTRPEGYL